MQQPVFRVGEWLVTPSVNQISRDGRQLTLEPRLIDLLVFFARHPDVVLSRDELIDNVWTRNIVTNHVVTQSISELRKSLKDGDSDSTEYIITVPKRGYKLAAPVIWCTSDGEPVPGDIMLSADEESGVSSPAEGTALVTPVGSAPPPTQASAPPPAVSPEQPGELAPAAGQKSTPRTTRFWVWLLFFLALATCVALVGLAAFSSRPPVTTTRILLNPRDIDIHLVQGSSCSNWSSRRAYVVGLSNLITTSLNTFSTFMVHDKTNYNYSDPSSSGKTLTIEFVNQRHYRAQQCFMSVRLVDNADSSIMLDKRYFITSDNQLKVQTDVLNNLSEVLKQPWPARMQRIVALSTPQQGLALLRFYQAHQLLIDGDADSLNKASEMLEEILQRWPDYHYARAEKALVDILRHSGQPLEGEQLAQLYQEIAAVGAQPGMQESAIYYQIKTIDLLVQGKIDEAYGMINKGIELEMSWINYVLLGKVYEMQGQNRLAADSYITAFNLRPGDNTLYWIKNGVFQTSVTRVVPYLDNFLAKE